MWGVGPEFDSSRHSELQGKGFFSAVFSPQSGADWDAGEHLEVLVSPDTMNFSSYLLSPCPSSRAQLLWYPLQVNLSTLFPKAGTEALAVPCTTACEH